MPVRTSPPFPQQPRTGRAEPRAAAPPDSARTLSRCGRRRVALGLTALAAVPMVLVAACGNAVVKQRDDSRPEPNASTEGVRSVYPSLPPPTPQGTAVPQKSGAGQSEGTGRS